MKWHNRKMEPVTTKPIANLNKLNDKELIELLDIKNMNTFQLLNLKKLIVKELNSRNDSSMQLNFQKAYKTFTTAEHIAADKDILVNFMIYPDNFLLGANQHNVFYIGAIDDDLNIRLFSYQNWLGGLVRYDGKMAPDYKSYDRNDRLSYNLSKEEIVNFLPFKNKGIVFDNIQDEQIPNIEDLVLLAYQQTARLNDRFRILIDKIFEIRINSNKIKVLKKTIDNK